LGSIGRLATPSNPLGRGVTTGTGRSDSCGPRPVLSGPNCQVITISGHKNPAICGGVQSGGGRWSGSP
jgi:hypothetical protein